MLNSTEREILNAYKYKTYQEIQLFSGLDKPVMLFFLLILFWAGKYFMLIRVEQDKVS